MSFEIESLPAETLRQRITALRADIEAARKRAARINDALEPRLKALNRLQVALALREAAAARHDDER